MRIPQPALILVLAFAGCQEAKQPKETIAVNNPAPAFVRSPLPGADVPYSEYAVMAEKGDTIFYPSGSILLFPPNAFSDKAGNIIRGEVKLAYRELTEPIDFFLAGIPMSFDSSGRHYAYQSGGMFELKAFKNGIPVFVNPAAKPFIALVGTGNEVISQVYFLDTVQRKWISKGMAVVGQRDAAGAQPSSAGNPAGSAGNILTVPVKPLLPSGNKPQIVIEVVPGSFPELMVYNNLKFELQDAAKSWDPKHADEEWSEIVLKRTAEEGLYSITFGNKSKTVTYKARPVLEGKDYEDAVKIFEAKQKDYVKAHTQRLEKESLAKERQIKAAQKNREEEIKLQAENEQTKKINALIEARNRQIEAQNERIVAENKRIAAGNKRVEIFYGFQLDGFGVWNCDRLSNMNAVGLRVRYVDAAGREIYISNSTTALKIFNTLLANTGNMVYVVVGTYNMVWGVVDGRFAYLSYERFRELHISPDSGEQTLQMTILPADQSTYKNIKAIVQGL